ncbi:MAG: 50S ribosomal protein L21 [Nitrospiria bacterium]
MRAVMEAGGRQYRVAAGDVVDLEKYDVPVGQSITFDAVLMLQDDNGVTVDPEALKGAKVIGEVLEQGRSKKIIVFKKKRRKNYRKSRGHRQMFTRLKISEIVKGSQNGA